LDFRKEKLPMGVSEGGMRLIQVQRENARLIEIELLRGPLRRALGDRRTFYPVRIEAVGRVGEVLVSIAGSKGLPILLRGRRSSTPSLSSGQ